MKGFVDVVAGQTYMRAGERTNAMLVVASGKIDYNGRVYDANQYFFESSLHSEELADGDVRATGDTPARLIAIERDAVEGLIGQPLAEYRGKNVDFATLKRASVSAPPTGGKVARRRSLAVVMLPRALETDSALGDFELLRGASRCARWCASCGAGADCM